MQCVQEKRDRKYFLHNFNKFGRFAKMFGTHHREGIGKLPGISGKDDQRT